MSGHRQLTRALGFWGYGPGRRLRDQVPPLKSKLTHVAQGNIDHLLASAIGLKDFVSNSLISVLKLPRRLHFVED